MNEKNVWSRPPRFALKEIRQKEAKRRAEAHAKLSTREKLKALDDLLGEGLGAKKERAKLGARLAKEEQGKAAKSETKSE